MELPFCTANFLHSEKVQKDETSYDKIQDGGTFLRSEKSRKMTL